MGMGQFLRRAYQGSAARIRARRVPGLVDELRRAPLLTAGLMPVVARLREAWGNTVWSADLGCLEEMVTRAVAVRGPFLECGAGLSTLVLAVIAERKGGEVWTLEQDAGWESTVRGRLATARLHNVHLIHAPLKVRDGGAWYSLAEDALPRHFPLVFCDGPAVWKAPWPEPVYLAWRSRLVPELERRGIEFETIVLDDAQDSRCAALIDAWRLAGLAVGVRATPFGSHVVASAAAVSARAAPPAP